MRNPTHIAKLTKQKLNKNLHFKWFNWKINNIRPCIWQKSRLNNIPHRFTETVHQPKLNEFPKNENKISTNEPVRRPAQTHKFYSQRSFGNGFITGHLRSSTTISGYNYSVCLFVHFMGVPPPNTPGRLTRWWTKRGWRFYNRHVILAPSNKRESRFLPQPTGRLC